jgi:excisionase family DNA binding protein
MIHDNRMTMTAEQAAAALGISRGTAYEAVRTGQLPTIRIGRRVLVPIAGLHKLLKGAVDHVAGSDV